MASPLRNLQSQPFLLATGFRPFFVGAAIHAIVSIALWFFFYFGILSYLPAGMPSSLWHGHEMVFGFSSAVVAGFLLTAVPKWTQLPTTSPKSLLILVTVWCIARTVIVLPNKQIIWLAGGADLIFNFTLLYSIVRPILLRKSRRQIPILICLVTLSLTNLVFYLTFTKGLHAYSQQMNILGTLSIVGLIVLIAERIIPFFLSVRIPDYKIQHPPFWITYTGYLLFILFGLAQVIPSLATGLPFFSSGLVIFFLYNLGYWYHREVWSHPMTWVIYIGYAALPLSFLIYGLSSQVVMPPQVALHTLSIGAIGVLCIGMMVRVALGHSNLNVYNPPKGTAIAFSVLIISAGLRVLGPVLAPDLYSVWIGFAQVLWVGVFSWYAVSFLPILIRKKKQESIGESKLNIRQS